MENSSPPSGTTSRKPTRVPRPQRHKFSSTGSAVAHIETIEADAALRHFPPTLVVKIKRYLDANAHKEEIELTFAKNGNTKLHVSGEGFPAFFVIPETEQKLDAARYRYGLVKGSPLIMVVQQKEDSAVEFNNGEPAIVLYHGKHSSVQGPNKVSKWAVWDVDGLRADIIVWRVAEGARVPKTEPQSEDAPEDFFGLPAAVPSTPDYTASSEFLFDYSPEAAQNSGELLFDNEEQGQFIDLDHDLGNEFDLVAEEYNVETGADMGFEMGIEMGAEMNAAMGAGMSAEMEPEMDPELDTEMYDADVTILENQAAPLHEATPVDPRLLNLHTTPNIIYQFIPIFVPQHPLFPFIGTVPRFPLITMPPSAPSAAAAPVVTAINQTHLQHSELDPCNCHNSIMTLKDSQMAWATDKVLMHGPKVTVNFKYRSSFNSPTRLVKTLSDCRTMGRVFAYGILNRTIILGHNVVAIHFINAESGRTAVYLCADDVSHWVAFIMLVEGEMRLKERKGEDVGEEAESLDLVVLDEGY